MGTKSFCSVLGTVIKHSYLISFVQCEIKENIILEHVPEGFAKKCLLFIIIFCQIFLVSFIFKKTRGVGHLLLLGSSCSCFTSTVM